MTIGSNCYAIMRSECIVYWYTVPRAKVKPRWHIGDSFYEYLIKTYVYTNGVDHTALEIYKDALSAIEKKLIK